MEPWHAMPWYGMLLGPVAMVVMLVGVGLTAVLLVRWLAKPDDRMASHVRPGEISLDAIEEPLAGAERGNREVEERQRVFDG